jgi:hypothetical protein
MSKLNELGYLGARSGPPGDHPFFSQGAYKIGFTTTYEIPHSPPRPSNDWTEAQTRGNVADRAFFWKAKREWAVVMSHHEGEVDAQHLEWAIDEIASDPEIWIARFDEVLAFLGAFFVDVGYPLDPSNGTCSAWIHGLEPDRAKYVVVTAYNAWLQESGWSAEVVLPALSVSVAAPAFESVGAATLRVIPNPFRESTSVEFVASRAGRAQVEIWNLQGRRVRELDLGWIAAGPARFTWDGRADSRRPVASGVYWLRVHAGDETRTARVSVVR